MKDDKRKREDPARTLGATSFRTAQCILLFCADFVHLGGYFRSRLFSSAGVSGDCGLPPVVGVIPGVVWTSVMARFRRRSDPPVATAP